MDWSRQYKRQENKIDWDGIAEVVRASVSIEDALRFYCPSLHIRHHRCPCPIHNGKDLNFSYTDRGYRCFVCGASGDVVALVKEVCELSTRADAIRKLDADFDLHLPLNFHAFITPEISAKVNKARREAEARRKAKEDWEKRYNNAIDEYVKWDRIVLEQARANEKDIEAYCVAREKREEARYYLDQTLAEEVKEWTT